MFELEELKIHEESEIEIDRYKHPSLIYTHTQHIHTHEVHTERDHTQTHRKETNTNE